MAPYKQPITLLELCLKTISMMVDIACNALATNHRRRNATGCKRAICCIQEFLFVLPGRILDTLHNEYVTEVMDCDPRLRLEVYMHRNMKVLTIPKQYSTAILYADNVFWKTKLCYISKIVSLELFSNCCNNVLEVIGRCCLNLEHISIKMPHELKMPCNVSYVALTHLEKCKKLKVIYFSDYFRVKEENICRLLKALPALEEFDYKNFGCNFLELQKDVKSLNLRRVCMWNPEVCDIKSVCKLCTNLQNIYLQYPCLNFPSERPKDRHAMSALTSSSLELSAVKLSFIIVDEEFFNYLHVKGKFLNSLTINVEIGDFSADLLYTIGKYCPELEYLALKNAFQQPYFIKDVDYEFSEEIMFSKLETLCIKGYVWDDILTNLPVALPHAKALKELTLHFQVYSVDIDTILNDILKKNPLMELCKLYVLNDLKFDTILYFFQFPHLKEITTVNHEDLLPSDINELKSQIKLNNLDISLNIIDQYNYDDDDDISLE